MPGTSISEGTLDGAHHGGEQRVLIEGQPFNQSVTVLLSGLPPRTSPAATKSLMSLIPATQDWASDSVKVMSTPPSGPNAVLMTWRLASLARVMSFSWKERSSELSPSYSSSPARSKSGSS